MKFRFLSNILIMKQHIWKYFFTNLYLLYPGIPWSLPLCIFRAIKSIPDSDFPLSSNRWLDISSVIRLSTVSIGVITRPRSRSSTICSSMITSGLLKWFLSWRSRGLERPSMACSLITVRLGRMVLCPNLNAAVANSLKVVAEHSGS